jgi:predicted PurR-regulated permease PerM
MFFGVLFVLIARFVPVVVSEVDRLSRQIPRYTEQAQQLIRDFNETTNRLDLPESVQDAIDTSLRNLEHNLVDALTRIPELTTNVARAVFNIILVLILTFYLLKDFALIKETLHSIVPRKSRSQARKILHEIDHSLGNYVRGQVLISSIIGVSSYMALLFLGVEFALILGIIAGITNIIPYFGPFIGAVPAVVVALLRSPALALKVIIVYTIIQQIESHLIAPQILGKSMGLHPVVVIMALIAGGQFFGIPGMIVAVPVVAVVRILIRNLVLPPVEGSRS